MKDKNIEKAILFANWIKENEYESDFFFSNDNYLWYKKDDENGSLLTSNELYELFIEKSE